MPSLEQKIIMYETLLHQIQLFREVVLDEKQLIRLLDNIGRWSYAHRRGNGELSDEEQQQLIDNAFYKLCDTK